MRILVTGAAGFIGQHLLDVAIKMGHTVVALSRSGQVTQSVEASILWKYGDALNLSGMKSIDVAVHLAHESGSRTSAARTIRGTIELIKTLDDFGVTRQLFVSSFSAGEHSESVYGRTKSELELILRKLPSVVIVRPGLVLGSGGIYGRMSSWARLCPFVPLPDGGRGKVPIIEIGRLCSELLKLCETKTPPKEFNAFHPDFVSLRELMSDVVKSTGRYPVIIPLRSSLLISVLRLFEKLRIQIPVSSDSVIGFRANQSAKHLSNLESK